MEKTCFGEFSSLIKAVRGDCICLYRLSIEVSARDKSLLQQLESEYLSSTIPPPADHRDGGTEVPRSLLWSMKAEVILSRPVFGL